MLAKTGKGLRRDGKKQKQLMFAASLILWTREERVAKDQHHDVERERVEIKANQVATTLTKNKKKNELYVKENAVTITRDAVSTFRFCCFLHAAHALPPLIPSPSLLSLSLISSHLICLDLLICCLLSHLSHRSFDCRLISQPLSLSLSLVAYLQHESPKLLLNFTFILYYPHSLPLSS